MSCSTEGALWLPTLKATPSPNQDARPDPQDVSLLVIHNISLPPGQFENGRVEQFFLNQLSAEDDPYFRQIAELRVSAHIFISRSGQAQQFVALDRRAWHAGKSCFEGRERCNDFSIGIELEGTDSSPYRRPQYETLADISSQIIAIYPNITTDRITGHSDIAPDRKTDPGPAFDWQLYRSLLTQD